MEELNNITKNSETVTNEIFKPKRVILEKISLAVMVLLFLGAFIFKGMTNNSSFILMVIGMIFYIVTGGIRLIIGKKWKLIILNLLVLTLMTLVVYKTAEANQWALSIYAAVWLYFAAASSNAVFKFISKEYWRGANHIVFTISFIALHLGSMIITKNDYLFFLYIIGYTIVISIFSAMLISIIVTKEKRVIKGKIAVITALIFAMLFVSGMKYRFTTEGLRELNIFSEETEINYAGGNFGIIEGDHFERKYRFSEGTAVIKISEKYGYINKKGEIIIKPVFTSAEEFQNGYGRISIGSRGGYVDAKGNILWDDQGE